MSALSRKSFRVELTDGSRFDVQSVNADTIAYERTRLRRKWPMITEGGVSTWWTFLAWSAAHRTGTYPGTYEEFETDAVDVDCTDDDDTGTGEPVDPTRPGPSTS